MLRGPRRRRGQRLLAASPSADVRTVRRRYRGDTLVLETEFETGEGSIRVIDFMPRRKEAPHVVRLVGGIRGRVRVHSPKRAGRCSPATNRLLRQAPGPFDRL